MLGMCEGKFIEIHFFSCIDQLLQYKPWGKNYDMMTEVYKDKG